MQRNRPSSSITSQSYSAYDLPTDVFLPEAFEGLSVQHRHQIVLTAHMLVFTHANRILHRFVLGGTCSWLVCQNGAHGGDRTHQPRFCRPVRSLARSVCMKWSDERDSNPRSYAPEAYALARLSYRPMEMVGPLGIEPRTVRSKRTMIIRFTTDP